MGVECVTCYQLSVWKYRELNTVVCITKPKLCWEADRCYQTADMRDSAIIAEIEEKY